MSIMSSDDPVRVGVVVVVVVVVEIGVVVEDIFGLLVVSGSCFSFKQLRGRGFFLFDS